MAIRDLTEGSTIGSLTHLAVPMLITGLLQNAQSLINLYWVSSLGKEAIASVAMGGTVLMVLFPAIMGLSTGTVALVARATGAGRFDEAGKAVSQSLMLALVLGVLSGLLGSFFSGWMLTILKADPVVIEEGGAYLRVALLGSFTVFLLFIGNAALQGAGDSMTPMRIMIVSNIINVVLDPYLIFGMGPFPRMGVRGAALAMIISQAVAAAIALWILLSGQARLHAPFRLWKPNLGLSWRILRIGIPGSGQMFARSLIGAFMMQVVSSCGVAAVAAYGTGLRLHMIVLMPAFALGGAAATLVGQNLGANKPERARRAAWAATGIDAAFMAVAATVLALAAPQLIGFFNTDSEVIHIGAHYLRIVSPFYIFTSFGIVLGRALNGAGDSLTPMLITILGLWVIQYQLAKLLAQLWQPPTQGVWWAMVGATVMQGLMVALAFETGLWKKQRV